MKAYIFLRTLGNTKREIIDNLEKKYTQSFIQGGTVYGWYDLVIELKAPNTKEINNIVDELKKNYTDIIHVGLAVERTADNTLFQPHTN